MLYAAIAKRGNASYMSKCCSTYFGPNSESHHTKTNNLEMEGGRERERDESLSHKIST